MDFHDLSDDKLLDKLRVGFVAGEAGSVEVGDYQGYVKIEKYEEDIAIERASYDALKLYTDKVCEQMKAAYNLSNIIFEYVPSEYIPVEYAKGMNDLYNELGDLGIEVDE